MDIGGKAIIVTGGAAGIGATYVESLASAGARVLVADLDGAAGEKVAMRLRDAGHEVAFVHTDVSDERSTQAMAAAAVEAFGAIDVLVNNAAMYAAIGAKRPFDEISVEEWDQVMAVNVRGVWLCMKAVVGQMRAQGAGKIVNISSGVVHAGVPWFCHYTASKAAVIGLTRSAARELGSHGINVNAVAPGLVDNDASEHINTREYLDKAPAMRALSRPMRPGDLVGAVRFLASPASDFITGQTFVVDGGVSMQ